MTEQLSSIASLYNSAHELPAFLALTNKYTYAISIGLIEGKYLDVNDAFNNDSPITSYITKHNAVLLFPNYIGTTLVSLFIRPLTSNTEPLKLGMKDFPYGIGQLDANFHYGDAIYIVEGIGDYAALKLVDPTLNVVALLSNSPSLEAVQVLSKLTNYIIVATDADDAGQIGFYSAIKKFKPLNVDVARLIMYGGHKDIGELLDIIVKSKVTNNPQLKPVVTDMANYYKIAISVVDKTR